MSFEKLRRLVVASSKFRLNWLSGIALVFSLLVVMILVVPGIHAREDRKEFVEILALQGDLHVFSHGWPFEYMRRSIDNGNLSPTKLEWASLEAWPTRGDVYEFRIYSLVADILVGGSLVVLATGWGACLARSSDEQGSHRRRWSFTVLHLLISVTAVTVILAWYGSHAVDRRLEDANHETLDGRRFNYYGPYYEYRGPMWLRRLVGKSDCLQFCYHQTAIEVPSTALEFSSENVIAIGRYRRAERMYCESIPAPEILKAMESLPRLSKLLLRGNSAQEFYGNFKYSSVSRPRRGSGMGSIPLLSRGTIHELSQFSELKSLRLISVGISAVDLEQLSRLKSLQHLDFSGRGIFIEDLQILRQFMSLEKIKLSITATDLELERFQSENPNLELEWETDFEFKDQHVLEARFQHTTEGDLDVTAGLPHKYLRVNRGDLKSQHLVFLEDKAIHSYVEQITLLELGEVDRPETVFDLVGHCPNLQGLVCPRLSFTMKQLGSLPARMDTLCVQQGELTVEDFQQLISRMPEGVLDIRESTMTVADALSIQEIAPDCNLMVHGTTSPQQQPWEAPMIYEW